MSNPVSGSQSKARVAVSSSLFHDPRRGLKSQILWFIRMRFAAVVGMWILTAAAALLGILDAPTPLFVLSGLTLISNVAYLMWVRQVADRGVRTLRRHVDLQIGVDLLILTAILHFAGGVTNPLVLSYLFHTFIAAFLLSARAAILVAAVSLLLLGGLGWSESTGVLPHRPLAMQVLELGRMGAEGVVLWLTSIGTVLGLSVYFVSTILRQLADRDEELVGLSRQLALSEKLASVGTLAAGVSHEINNPVAVIQTKADILRHRIADGDPPEALLGELDVIEKHTRRVKTITDGLLTFSRETPFELRPVRVNALVREAADLVRVPYKSAELGLDLRLAPEDPRLSGSANHLLQVLVNVLLNARDASLPGQRVSVATEAADGSVSIRIADQGHGIPAETIGKIFDPFFTTKDVDRGTGLGLALSHGIVERHGGRIEVTSKQGEGTEFRVLLPDLDP